MGWREAFVFPFKDRAWPKKLLLGYLLNLVPLLGFGVTGYMLEVADNVHAGREQPMPNWHERFWRRIFRGFTYAIMVALYTLAAIAAIWAIGYLAARGGYPLWSSWLAVEWRVAVSVVSLLGFYGLGPALAVRFFVSGWMPREMYRPRGIVGLVRAQPKDYFLVILVLVVTLGAPVMGAGVLAQRIAQSLPALWPGLVGTGNLFPKVVLRPLPQEVLSGPLYVYVYLVMGHIVGQFARLVDGPAVAATPPDASPDGQPLP